jgi:hypothetical protein
VLAEGDGGGPVAGVKGAINGKLLIFNKLLTSNRCGVDQMTFPFFYFDAV